MSVDSQMTKLKALVRSGNHSQLEIKDIWDQWLVGQYMRNSVHSLSRDGALIYLLQKLVSAGFPLKTYLQNFPTHTLDGSHTFAYNAWRV